MMLSPLYKHHLLSFSLPPKDIGRRRDYNGDGEKESTEGEVQEEIEVCRIGTHDLKGVKGLLGY